MLLCWCFINEFWDNYFWKHLRHFCSRNLVKVKLKEGKNPSYTIQLSLDKRFDCHSGYSFVQVLLFFEGKVNWLIYKLVISL